jgi:hypothetical protein
MRLRPFFYGAVTALAACSGCLSVDIETRAERTGGGTRSYVVTLDPSLATTYESASSAGKVFRLPGDDLLGKPGVALVARSQAKDTSGVMQVRKSFRAGRLTDAGTPTDSIRYEVVRGGLWVTYRYAEHYLASDIDSSQVGGATGERYRFRHALRLPGRIVTTDADSARDGAVIWSRPMRQVRADGLAMSAESREIDPLALAVLAICALAAGMLAAVFRLRRTGT